MLLPTAMRALHRTTALGGRVNDGRQLGSAPSPRDFKLEHMGTQGRLPIGVQDPATDVVVDAPLSDGRARHMERIVAGPESWEAVDVQRAVLLLWRRGVPGGRPGLPVGSDVVADVPLMAAVRDTVAHENYSCWARVLEGNRWAAGGTSAYRTSLSGGGSKTVFPL